MTVSQLTSILSKLGITNLSNYIQVPGIDKFIMPTNIGLDPYEDFIYFDTTNKLIKIKHKYPTPHSGQIIDFNISGNQLVSKNGYDISVQHPRFTFRKPQIGDNVVFINPTTGNTEPTAFTITSVSRTIIKLSGNVPMAYANHIVAYTDLPLTTTPYSEDKSLYFEYQDITDNVYDVLVDLDAVVGIQFTNNRLSML